MIVVENECVGCPDNMNCLYEACQYYNVVRLYCDECHEEVDELYAWDNGQICLECILKQLERVEPDE